MANIFKKKTWHNVGESEATDENSIHNAKNDNDLEQRIADAIEILNKKTKDLETKLVAQAMASDSNQNELVVDGLDIVKDGGVYEVVIAEYGAEISQAGHVLRINDEDNENAYSNRLYTHDESNLFSTAPVHNGLCYTNGWNSDGLFYTTGKLIYFDNNWIGFIGQSFYGVSENAQDQRSIKNMLVLQGGSVVFANVENITKLRIHSLDKNIGEGSFIKVYKM